MDTRSKILTADAAARLKIEPPVVVTGYFDPLLAAHARELEEVRRRTTPRALLVVVLPSAGELLSQRARAELVAALRVVDYVVTTGSGGPDFDLEFLRPSEIVRLETADTLRTRQLREHVHRGQARK
ncbi:MAG TPA: hypothetical protein VG675_21585 [Bryobacteraceae bacterium]|nr:hypothetical protein [Bryobacteraceae bacterium]